MSKELLRCLMCGDGVIVVDPKTEHARCCNCGISAHVEPPVVAGGQGREQDGEDARVFAYSVAIVLALVGVVWYFATHLPSHQP